MHRKETTACIAKYLAINEAPEVNSHNILPTILANHSNKYVIRWRKSVIKLTFWLSLFGLEYINTQPRK